MYDWGFVGNLLREIVISECAIALLSASDFPLNTSIFTIMDELKAKLTGLGLSDEMASQAIQAVGEFVKSKMPEQFQGVIDQLLSGQSPDLGSLSGGLLSKMKGMFGS